MKNKLVLVSGYVAAGKTAFSHKLAQELNIPCFNYDAIDETICDFLGSEMVETHDEYDKESQEMAFCLMLHIIERLFIANNACILEGSFELEEINVIKKLLDKYNYECLLFILKGDPKVMFDRYVKRDKSGERHWIHAPAYEDWIINVMPTTRGLEKSEIKLKIAVDTTSFEKVDYNDLIVSANEFITMS